MKELISLLVLSVLIVTLVFSLIGCNKIIERDENSFYLTYKDNFKIMQLADIQVPSVEACNEAFKEIDKMVYGEKPDLIVLTGDNIDWYADKGTFEALVRHMDKYSVNWAPVFGNHDDEQDPSFGVTKQYMAEVFNTSEYCLFNVGSQDVNGVGNYVINLTDEKQTKIEFSLIFMDSNTYRTYDLEDGSDSIDGWDYIYPNQIDWYEQSINNITKQNHNKSVKSLTFFHIPLMEFETAKELQLNNGNLGWGELREEMGAPMENTGLFDKMKELNSCVGVICGHAHINNCDLLYEGIHLICGLKSSRYSYYNEDMLGCTVYTLNDGEFVAKNIGFVSD